MNRLGRSLSRLSAADLRGNARKQHPCGEEGSESDELHAAGFRSARSCPSSLAGEISRRIE
jgi:hypothetical protein